ncbi:tyrosine-protein phosphatase [Nocardiopsis sp. CNT-189]|uniref:tyrosine-protein phosphatase n=1 Tax=Nocardiopsis oceanisediminis TaxID=2816862 RepID=UPI003B2F0F6A
MPPATELPPNWRPVQFPAPTGARPTPSPDTLYRAAALSLATPGELAACPHPFTWFDLRTDGERALDRADAPAKGLATVAFPVVAGSTVLSRDDMARVFGALVAGELSFGDLYLRMLAESTERFAAAVEALAAIEGRVAIACQGGRDRTGVLVALILDLVGVERRLIVEDYLRTNDDQESTDGRQPDTEGERLLAGYDMTCKASDIEQVLDYLRARGGSRGYLSAYIAPDRLDEVAAALRARIMPAARDRDPEPKGLRR